MDSKLVYKKFTVKCEPHTEVLDAVFSVLEGDYHCKDVSWEYDYVTERITASAYIESAHLIIMGLCGGFAHLVREKYSERHYDY